MLLQYLVCCSYWLWCCRLLIAGTAPQHLQHLCVCHRRRKRVCLYVTFRSNNEPHLLSWLKEMVGWGLIHRGWGSYIGGGRLIGAGLTHRGWGSCIGGGRALGSNVNTVGVCSWHGWLPWLLTDGIMCLTSPMCDVQSRGGGWLLLCVWQSWSYEEMLQLQEGNNTRHSLFGH